MASSMRWRKRLRPDSGPARRWWPVILLGVMAPAALAAFFYLRSVQPSGISGGGTRVSDEQLQDTYAELCRTRALAATDLPAARDLFFGRVHSPLHAIAQAAEEVDRPAAASMLEAKNDVERALNEHVPATDTAAALDRLVTSTTEALRSVGVTTSGCEIP